MGYVLRMEITKDKNRLHKEIVVKMDVVMKML